MVLEFKRNKSVEFKTMEEFQKQQAEVLKRGGAELEDQMPSIEDEDSKKQA